MAKVKFYCDSGANVYSSREETLDTVKDLNFKVGEWEQMTDDEKYKEAEIWAFERLDIGVEDLD